VVGLYTIHPTQWVDHDWADIKVEFILRNLQCLSDQLGRLNIPLLMLSASAFHEVPQALLKLARGHKCDALYFNR
jgi:deoxyribodipyrimidine photo-lyase